MATNTEKIVVQVVVKGQKGLDKVGKSAGGGAKSFAKMAGAIALAGTAFSAINKQIGAAINTFKKFEFQMAKVKATTGATEKDFKKLTATAQQLGRTTFFTASQVGELQMNYAKLGFTTSEILDAQEATLRLATATGSDLARAAVVAGAAVRGFNLDASETERVVDVMAVAFTSSALDIEKWQTSMTKVAPIAAGAGVSIESTAAVMGKLTDAGIEASIAGTSMRNIFLKMQDSSSDLSKHLGFTVKSSDDLEKALIQLNKEGLSNEEIMGLVDLRQVAAFATMVNGTDSILEMTDALEDANGAAQEMADIMADTLEGDIITAKSAWEGFQLALMTGSSEVSRSLRRITQAWTQLLNNFSDDLKSTEQIAADVFTNIVQVAKGQVKELKELSEINDDESIAISFSKSLEISLNDLEKTLPALEKKMLKAKSDLDSAWKDAPMGFGAESYDVTFEKAKKQFEATKQAIIDLVEEIKVQQEKEVTAKEVADAKQFQKEQQAKRDAKKEADRIKREKEKEKRDAERQAEKDRRNKAKRLKDAIDARKKAFQDEKDAVNVEYQELLNAHKQALINEEITQETYDEAAFDMEQQRLEDMKNLLIKYKEDTSDINGEILDNELQIIAAKKKAEADAKAAKEKADKDKAAKDKAAKEKLEREEQQDFKESQDAFKVALQEEINADKQNLIDGVITKEEFDLRVFEAEQAHLENMKNLNIAYAEDVSAINSQILDNDLKMIADKAEADAKVAKDKEDARKKEIDSVSQLGNQLINLAGEDEKMQDIRKVGIQLSAAAAIANNIESLSLAAKGVAKQSTLLFPANLIAMAGTIGTVISLFANIKAMKDSFGDGGIIETFANGGMVHGKSHAQGGEKFAVGGRVVELEGGEAVINKRSTAMFSRQLSAMNSAGGGVKFADGGLLNMPSFSQQQFNAIGQNQIMGAMESSGKVVVVEADITDSQNSVSVIQSEATI